MSSTVWNKVFQEMLKEEMHQSGDQLINAKGELTVDERNLEYAFRAKLANRKALRSTQGRKVRSEELRMES